MNEKKVKLSNIKIIAHALVGLVLAIFSFMIILTIIDGFVKKEKIPYLYGAYTPYREILVIGVCIVVFVLIFLFNMYVKRKWLYIIVNIIIIIAVCNPFTFALGLISIPEYENYYTIENETEFNQCADDMVIDFSNFPKFNEFEDQNVQFVGKVCDGFFFYQSITAIVKYDSLEQCDTDYKTYIDSHQFLTESVIDCGGDYLIAASEFNYEGIFFKVVTEGGDYFPKQIYMIGIDRENSALYYLYLNDHDLDYIADSNAQDLEYEMCMLVAEQFNLGK